jgi:molecular chaperone GrpE
MADRKRKIPINQSDDIPDRDTTEAGAGDFVPALIDQDDDDYAPRRPYDLDAPIDIDSALADADPANDVKDEPPAIAAEWRDAAAEDAVSAQTAADTRKTEALQAELAQAHTDRLRALADLQNFRRRAEEERLRIIREANEKLIRELLPILDDFDLAVIAAKSSQSFDQLIGGVEAIQRKVHDTLGKQGVAPITTVGEKFDPDLHEAVMLDETTDLPDETITSELRKGYRLHNRIIRPSLVKVAKNRG